MPPYVGKWQRNGRILLKSLKMIPAKETEREREREREIYFQQFNMLVNASHTEGSPKNPLAGNLEMKESVLNSISLWRYLKSCCLTLIGRWMPGRGCGSRARRSSTSSSTVTAPSNSDAKSIPTEISSSKLDGDGFGYWRENCRWLIPIRLSISQKVPAGSKKLPTAIHPRAVERAGRGSAGRQVHHRKRLPSSDGWLL